MTRILLVLVLTLGLATGYASADARTTDTGVNTEKDTGTAHGEGAISATDPRGGLLRVPSSRRPAPVSAPTSPRPASRSTTTRPSAISLGVLDVTAYCWTGSRTASGVWPARGQVATLAPIRFGTRLRVGELGVFTVTDRIGHGSEVDVYLDDRDGSCERDAAVFGRRQLEVWEVTR